MTYLFHIIIFISIYVILAVSLNLLAGYTGILTIAHAAFYGIGAYTSALFAIHFKSNFFIGMIAGMVIAGLVTVVIGYPALKIHDDYLVIATFGFQMIVFSIFNNWVSLTRGPFGIPGIPKPTIFGFALDNNFRFMVLSIIIAALVFIFCKKVTRSPFGRVLKAIREDEIFTQSLGKPVMKYKLIVFVISSMLAAIAGSIFAHYVTYIDPTSFTVIESIFIISIVIIGGAGSLWGSILGSILLISVPEALRFIGMPNVVAANIRQIFYGVLLIIFMMFRPSGLIGEYEFKKNGTNPSN